MELLLGVDGGGTKTDVVAAPVDGVMEVRTRVGGSSLSRVPAAGVEKVLRTGVERAVAGCGGTAAAVVAACAGLASAAAPERAAVYAAMLQRLLPRARLRVMGDAELAWHGAAGGRDAIVVIAGTGAIAWGRYRGRSARAGGRGPGDDAGSADWLGRRAVEAGLAAAPAGDDYAGLLPQLARRGGVAVEAMFQQAGRELAQLVEHCAGELGWGAPEVYAWGGVFDHVPAIRRECQRACGHRLRALAATPTQAALALAGELWSPAAAAPV